MFNVQVFRPSRWSAGGFKSWLGEKNVFGGNFDMSKSNYGEQLVNFKPFLNSSEAIPEKSGRNRVSPYKLVLAFHDFFAAIVAFGFSLWANGLNLYMREDFSQARVVLVISLMVIAFFPTYNLYNYHLIFSLKRHIASLLKSVGWSFLSLGILVSAFTWPDFFVGKFSLPVVFCVALGLMAASRFFGDQVLNLLKSIGLAFLAIGIILLISPDRSPVILDQWATIPTGLGLALGIFLISRSLLVHVVFNKWMRRRFRRQIAIVGSNKEAQNITNHIIRQNAPFWVSGIIGRQDTENLEVSVSKDRLGGLEDLPDIAKQKEIDEIIVTDENIDQKVLISLLDYCTSEGLTVWFPPKLMPIIDMKLYIDSFCGLSMIRLCSQKNTWMFNKIKHGLDALVTLPMFLLLVPVFLLIGAAIKLNSPGPLFYRAKAIGKNGREFEMYKFRSMKAGNGNGIHKDYVTKLIKGEIRDEGKKDQVFKIEDDPRITFVGRFLRKFSIDELPQIINVLKADMSLVGPRPCLPYEYEVYKDWHKKRLSIRPGITGLWQVAGRSAVKFEDMVILDLYYIYNRNLMMDMNILYETLFAVLEKRGAH
jgi:exopolysaccharide biosynthesis polyprenyl glycosylphosphotransferase